MHLAVIASLALDCVTPCAPLICPSTPEVGALVEARVVAPQDPQSFRYLIEVTAIHGTPRQALAVGDRVLMEGQYGQPFSTGDDVLARTDVAVDRVVGFAVVGADQRVSCADVTDGRETFAVDKSVLIDAIERKACPAELEARGYDFPRCDDTSMGCAVGARSRGGGWLEAAALLLGVACARWRRRTSRPASPRG